MPAISAFFTLSSQVKELETITKIHCESIYLFVSISPKSTMKIQSQSTHTLIHTPTHTVSFWSGRAACILQTMTKAKRNRKKVDDLRGCSIAVDSQHRETHKHRDTLSHTHIHTHTMPDCGNNFPQHFPMNFHSFAAFSNTFIYKLFLRIEKIKHSLLILFLFLGKYKTKPKADRAREWEVKSARQRGRASKPESASKSKGSAQQRHTQRESKDERERQRAWVNFAVRPIVGNTFLSCYAAYA